MLTRRSSRRPGTGSAQRALGWKSLGPSLRGGERWLAVLLALVLVGTAQAAPTFPKLTGRVVDNASILSPQTEARLTQELAALEQQTTRQVVVVTLPDLQGYEIEEYGYQLGRTWGIGQKGEDNGALLIVAPNQRKVRIEVGYGLEPVLTDALSSQILQQQVLPRFRAGDMEGGVVAGAKAIVQQLALPDEEARQNVAVAAAQTQQAANPGHSPLAAVLILVFIFMMVGGLFGRRGRRRGGLGSALPWIILAGMSSGGGRGGGWSGGGGGFGGFSGGGGSFGGGGSSGGW